MIFYLTKLDLCHILTSKSKLLVFFKAKLRIFYIFPYGKSQETVGPTSQKAFVKSNKAGLVKASFICFVDIPVSNNSHCHRNVQVFQLQLAAIKGTHTIYLRISFYNVNQKPMSRTNFHCETTRSAFSSG